ncbi:MAG: VirB3 family type IV secretion system protein [Synergistaceae bacterium]|jgi:type IV secretory pathway TrbD component|nr:VirB3 family type IV secretion system protein [Synergistaceae bacterium]
MKEQIRTIPIHRSLARPQLIMGCERVLFLMLCMVVTLLAGPGGIMSKNLVNVFLGGAFFFIGRAVLSRMAKADPMMSGVFKRSVRYRPEYPASGTAGFRNTPKPRRW